jgi:hypothetical protein
MSVKAACLCESHDVKLGRKRGDTRQLSQAPIHLVHWSEDAPDLRLTTVQTLPVLHASLDAAAAVHDGARHENGTRAGARQLFERHLMQCGAFITAAVTAGGTCRSLIIWRARMLIQRLGNQVTLWRRQGAPGGGGDSGGKYQRGEKTAAGI